MKETMSDPCRRRRPPAPPVDPLVALSNLAAIRSQMDSLHRFLSTSVAANTILPKSTVESVSSQISDALHHVILNSALLISLSSSRSDTHMQIIEIEKTQMPIGKILEEEKHTENNLYLVCNNRGKNKTTYISSSPDSILIETADSGEQLNTSPFSSVDTQMPIHKISKEVETAGNGPSVCNRGKAECASPSPDLVLAGASGSGEQANGSNLSSTETQMSICEIKKRAEQVVVEEDAEEEERERDGEDGDVEVVDLDAVELLAEHLHFCEICGKGFRRDANLRMHMRAHGDRFKSPGALAKPENSEKTMNMSTAVRFSCPYAGCNRSRKHKKFRALKSVMCVKNHFKRSHCPKMYACDRCNKESFSVLADLKSHLRHCGEARWRCSCGTSFSRKDKLFGNMALFEGHMPAVGEDECAQGTGKAAVDDATMVEATRDEENVFDDGFLERLGSIEDKFLQELLGTSSDSSIGIDGFFNF